MRILQPAYYRIYVEGKLDTLWLNDYFDLRAEWLPCAGKPGITLIAGELVDQSALMGVLCLMNESGLPLLGFDCIPYLQE